MPMHEQGATTASGLGESELVMAETNDRRNSQDSQEEVPPEKKGRTATPANWGKATERVHLSQVEVDEVLCLVRHVRAKVAANNAVPGWVVFFVELLLDKSSNVFLDVVFFERLCCAIDGVLLHVLRHIGILDYGLPVGHGDQVVELSPEARERERVR